MSHTTIYRALMVAIGLLLLNIANQASKSGKAVQTVEVGVDWFSDLDGSEEYYPTRDTSFLRYLCCGVIR